jgi:hypothetical protein
MLHHISAFHPSSSFLIHIGQLRELLLSQIPLLAQFPERHPDLDVGLRSFIAGFEVGIIGTIDE